MITLRKIAEKFSRGVSFKRRFVVGDKLMPILVSPDAQLKYMKPGRDSFDEDLVRLATRYLNESDVVWDIGANIGTFTFAAASMVGDGSVLTVEADGWLVELLRKTARLKDYDECDIKILSAAISDTNSVSPFTIASRGRASNALVEAGGRSQMGGTRETQYVATLTLDTLLASMDEPNFVKIDIEGAELLALQGAGQLISEVRPSFYIEVGEDVAPSVYKIFSQANYRCVDPITEKESSKCVENTLFIPN